MHDIPLLVVALIVSAYWLRVGAMAIRIRRREHRDVGMVPERPGERLMWLLLVPMVVAWCVLPWVALAHSRGPFSLPGFATAGAWPVLRWVAAAAAVAGFAMTIECWRRMGKDWRMDISDEHTVLITDGPFRRVRHPIYAFSILIMLATAVVLPTPSTLALAALHLSLMNIKARSEEAHLARMHGDAWLRYVERTGRFLPRLAGRHS
ncbi:MAG: isoprenylcysteine carboxylmethyltransferase family protein [Betaproteobacteria bacterium]|nr:isoprenylcysteine carboxylmethyltransferase family protein [Betaproteobacteria bacterium]